MSIKFGIKTDYLNEEQPLDDKLNKTIEVSDNSFNEAALKSLAPKIATKTLHKTYSPGTAQARVTVTGDDSYDNSDIAEEDEERSLEETAWAPTEKDLHRTTSREAVLKDESAAANRKASSKSSTCQRASIISINPLIPKCQHAFINEITSESEAEQVSEEANEEPAGGVEVLPFPGMVKCDYSNEDSNLLLMRGPEMNSLGEGIDGNASASATVRSLEIRENIVATASSRVKNEAYRDSYDASPTPQKGSCWQTCFGGSRRKKT